MSGEVARPTPSTGARARALLLRLASERIVQFFVLGLALFLLLPPGQDSYRISVDAEQLEALKAAQARRLGQRALDGAEAQQVEVTAAEDELLYREALRLGLDRSDDVVRRRLVQKMLFLAEDLGGATRPASDEELRRYLQAHAERYAGAERRRFLHAFATTEAAARALTPSLPPPAQAASAPPSGEAFPLPRDVSLTQAEVAASYGEAFAAAVFTQPVGEARAWSDVLPSKFGFHRVLVVERTPGGPQPFEAVAGRLRLDELNDRRQRAVSAFVSRAASRYRIDLAGRPFVPGGPDGPERRSGRVAFGTRATDEGKGD